MLGKPVPDFSLPSTGGNTFQLSIKRANCEVLGISRDSLASHQRLKAKMKFPFELKQVRGIPKGLRGVRIPGHVQEVLNFVKAL
jgi:thioredoxin-dependent peroxiredoxin